jgi:hypothetical protein
MARQYSIRSVIRLGAVTAPSQNETTHDTRVRGNGSKALQPGFNKGRTPANKGKRVVSEPLTPDEVRALFAAFSSDRYPTGARNRAMATLMYRLGWKPKQVVDLEMHHYRRGETTITVPPAMNARGRAGTERTMKLDAETRRTLDRWLDQRKRLDPGALTPFFCTHLAGRVGHKINEGYLNRSLRRAAKKADIEKRVSPLVLRATYLQERSAEHAGALGISALTYLDEHRFRQSYPRAYERWLVAVTLFEDDAEKHADRIGDECRKALAAYADEVAQAFSVPVRTGAGTHEKLRTVLRSQAKSATAAGVADALVKYWKASSTASQALAHAPQRAPEQRTLGREDARRAVFNALFVMHEADHALRVA